jgi:quinol monooxygenase YgiN
MADTPTVGLLVTMEARPGKESDVEQFLDSGLSLVNQEPGTALWFALHLGGSSYGIFDVFLDDAGRDAHLHGKVAEALMAQAPDLFTDPPAIQKIDIRSAKLP